MRRSRRDDFSRRLVREARLASEDLILPVFVREVTAVVEAVPSMPGVSRCSVDELLKVVEQALTLGIPAITLFPVTEAKLKTAGAEEAFNPSGLVQRSIREVKKRFPEMGVITDIALDPYTIHGQDGLVDAAARHTGHRGHGLHDLAALANEHREDEVFRCEARLAHQAASEVVAARAAHAPIGKTAEAGGHLSAGKKSGTLAFG